MRSDNTNTIKRNISFILILLTIAVSGAAFDVSIDAFSAGGCIKAKSSVPAANSLPPVTNTGFGEDNNNGEGLGKNPGKAVASTALTGRAAGKQTCLFSDRNIYEPFIHFSICGLSICTLYCVSLFRLTLISLIHLKDGSK